MSSHFFAYMSRMKYIDRWNIMRNTEKENILEHSAQCAMIAHALCVIKNRLYGGSADPDRVAARALYHEAGEVITGDLATPIKYFNPDIKNAFKAIEDIAEDRLLAMLPPELVDDFRGLVKPVNDEEHALLKAADKLCAYIKCLEEQKAGNGEFERARDTIERELKSNPLPEVKYFMEVFIPSFLLTLDELN